jgi:hypothetical protein
VLGRGEGGIGRTTSALASKMESCASLPPLALLLLPCSVMTMTMVPLFAQLDLIGLVFGPVVLLLCCVRLVASSFFCFGVFIWLALIRQTSAHWLLV